MKIIINRLYVLIVLVLLVLITKNLAQTSLMAALAISVILKNK